MKLFPIRLRGDKIIWGVVFLLAFLSILSVHSSSYQSTMKTGSLFAGLLAHLRYLGVGFFLIYILHVTPIPYFKKFAPLALLFSVGSLIFVFLTSQGRWALGFQPSELARLVIIVYLAKVISEGISSVKEFCTRILLPIALFCGLIINWHTSSTIMLGICALFMIVLGISNKKYLLITFLSIMAAGILYFAFDEYLGRGLTAKNRVENFFSKSDNKSPVKDTIIYDPITKKSVTKQIIKPSGTALTQERIAEIAINSGGMLGRGPGNSKYRKTLTQANNDFIFAIIIEEYGLLLGGLPVIGLYLVLFLRVILIVKRCNKIFPALLVSGLTLMIIIQAFIHIGVSLGGLPVTGQNLPMISTGGSSIIMTGLALGMILSVSRRIEEQRKLKAKNQSVLTQKPDNSQHAVFENE